MLSKSKSSSYFGASWLRAAGSGAARLVKNRSKAGLALINQQIAAGVLAASANHQVYDPKATYLTIQAGWNGIAYQWWGVQYYFDEWRTTHIELALFGGAVGAGLCTVILTTLVVSIPWALACAIAAAVLSAGALYMQWVDNGKGDIVNNGFNVWWLSGQ
jgi:hypothetical protein